MHLQGDCSVSCVKKYEDGGQASCLTSPTSVPVAHKCHFVSRFFNMGVCVCVLAEVRDVCMYV